MINIHFQVLYTFINGNMLLKMQIKSYYRRPNFNLSQYIMCRPNKIHE